MPESARSEKSEHTERWTRKYSLRMHGLQFVSATMDVDVNVIHDDSSYEGQAARAILAAESQLHKRANHGKETALHAKQIREAEDAALEARRQKEALEANSTK
jgi:hypothetical protein